MFITDFSIRKPVTTVMLMAGVLVFGLIGYSRLGVDEFPNVDFPIVTVTTLLKGASPEVVEENVTDIIEEEVGTIEGLRNLTSVSSHGASVVTLEFNLERDVDLAAQDVRDKVSRAVRDLPDDAEAPVVDKLDTQAQPIMWIAISGSRKIQEITYFADEVLKPRLETIKGVGSILVGGKRERTIRIWLDRARLEAMGIASSDVVDALKKENVEIPGGFLESRDMEFTVKTEGEFETVDAFNGLIVAYRSAYPVRLKDIGRVEDGLEDARSLARYNGLPAVGLGIRKKAGGNTVETADLVKAELEKALGDLPEGMKADVAYDSSVFIKEAVEEVQFSLVFGGLLASLVVFAFLRSIVLTFIVAVAIPLSVIGTFFVMYLLGFTMNTMTMLALTLSIGVVVDDAIIIMENIYRHRERGKAAMEGARSGASEIAFAAMAATMSLAAVFVPVAFMKGIVGRFFYEFGLTVSVAIFISLFVALTLTPMLCSRRLVVKEKHGRLFMASERFYRSVEAIYRAILAWSLRYRLVVVVAAVSIFAGSLMVWGMLGKEFMPNEDKDRFMVRFETPVGSSIDYTDEKLRRNEEALKSIPEVRSFFGAIGLGEAGRVTSGMMFVRLHPRDERERGHEDIIGEARGKFNMEPGMKAFAEAPSAGFGSRRGPQLEFIVKGPTIEELDMHSKEIAKRFKEIKGIVDVDTDLDIGLPELRINIDRERAADLGVDVQTIAAAINTLIGGQDATRYKEAGKRYDVRVKLDESWRRSHRDVEMLHVRGGDGRLVRLEGMVDVEESSAVSVINRKDRQRSVTIYANMEEGKTLGEAITDVSGIAGEVLPEGFSTKLGGTAELFSESMTSIMITLALAVLITYMVLASQFESMVHPLTVMLALPLSIVGALGGLYVTGNTLNIYSFIGLMLLIGLVTKNSILLVDYTNTLRGRGMGIREAVLEAGPVRLRPILMTALSTIFGVLPTALGIGPGSESRAPMAIAAMGGMITSTFLTLVVVPVVYTLFEDMRGFFAGRRAS